MDPLPFAIRYSLFAIRYSLFAIRYSLFAIRYSLFASSCAVYAFCSIATVCIGLSFCRQMVSNECALQTGCAA